MQRAQLKRRHCRKCGRKTKHERFVTAMGCGDLVLTICTLGLWVVLRHVFTPKFRCSECGA